MAGESPDRSKQHGSSPEATSGNGAPVPGPTKGGRDPRLSTGAEKARVDQATTVLSTRALNGGTADTAVKEAEEPTASGASGASGGDDAQLRQSLASWVRSAEEDGKADQESGEGSEEALEESAKASEESAEEPAESAEEPEGESEPEAEAEAAADGDADADEATAVSDDVTEPEAKADVTPEVEEAGETEEAEEAEESDEADETPEGETTAEGADEAEAEEEIEPEEKAESDVEKDGEKGDEEAPKAEDAPKPPVDQPTAVFKAPRKPAVDQPTTMLKLGGVKPSDKPTPSWADKSGEEDKADRIEKAEEAEKTDEPAAKAPAESEAERTSRFIPLKSLDEPKAVPDATAALPQVGPERTAQQPLPPKPPLDLLAELTNTPPPPDTPVRTALRRVKIWTPLVVLLVIVFAIVQAVRPLPTPTLALTADRTYTFAGGKLDLPWPGQGQSAVEVEGVGMVGTEGAQTPKPIASVTKIMTAYVILQQHPLKGNDGGPVITVDQQAADESKNVDESTAALKKDQKFTERQMLQMLMIPSGNNVARLLARWDSDNQTFVGKMNAAAKKLGMTHTTYTDPSGLNKTTVSTAVDQLKLAKAVMQNEVFRSVVGMAKADIPGLDKPIYNNNDLLVKQVGVIGLKTGSSTPAGGDLVWAATKVVDGRTRTIYGAVLNQDARTGRVWDSLQLALDNSQKLIDKIQKSLTSATVVKKGEVVGYVDDQFGGKTPVVATENLTAVGWPGLSTQLSIGDNGTELPHEAKAGKVIGKLTVGDGSSHAVSVPVALQKDLAEPGYGAKFTRLG